MKPCTHAEHQHVLAGQLEDAEPLHADWMTAWHTFGGLPELFDAGLAMRHPLQRVRAALAPWALFVSEHAGTWLLAGNFCVAGSSTLVPAWLLHAVHILPERFPCHAAVHVLFCEHGAAGHSAVLELKATRACTVCLRGLRAGLPAEAGADGEHVPAGGGDRQRELPGGRARAAGHAGGARGGALRLRIAGGCGHRCARPCRRSLVRRIKSTG